MEKFLNLPKEKQNRIIDAALAVFGENGYKKTSVNDVAVAAGISKAMVFHYFGTKKDLFLYLVDFCYDMVSKEIENKFDLSVTDFFDRIKQASDIKVSVLSKHPASISFLTMIYFETDEEVKEAIKNILSRSEELQKNVYYNGMDTSKFKEGIDPQKVLKILTWMAEGFANGMKAKDFSRESLSEYVDEYYECMNLLRSNFYKDEYR